MGAAVSSAAGTGGRGVGGRDVGDSFQVAQRQAHPGAGLPQRTADCQCLRRWGVLIRGTSSG